MITVATPAAPLSSPLSTSTPVSKTTSSVALLHIVITFSTTCNYIRIQVSLRKHFTFTNPYLHAYFSINSLCKYISIINVHT